MVYKEHEDRLSGAVIRFREYRLEDFYTDRELERIPREAVLGSLNPNSLQGNVKMGRKRILHYIIQEFLNIIVDRVLERDIFVHHSTRILIREIPREKTRQVKKKKQKQPLFHSRGRRYGLVLETGFPHRYYLRMKAWLRYELFDNIRNKGYDYQSLKK